MNHQSTRDVDFPSKRSLAFARGAVGRLLACGLGAALAIACQAPQVRVVRGPADVLESIDSIAVLPGGGVLSDALSMELLARGIEVIDAEQVASLVLLDEGHSAGGPGVRSLSRLQDEGIDAALQSNLVLGYDARPQTVTVRIIQTGTGKLIAGVTWKNGSGGERGSPADQDARVDVDIAAQQIADAIVRILRAPRGELSNP
ncbi:MAG TPA: hypothetical protein EYQ27_15340 [Gemmatimonadetes bacterium]|nr:hypothetical protein [Gemmatimonadota bacterium]